MLTFWISLKRYQIRQQDYKKEAVPLVEFMYLVFTRMPCVLIQQEYSPKIPNRKPDHEQILLCSLHWLAIHLRMKFKTSALCFKTFIDYSHVYFSWLLYYTQLPEIYRSSSDTRISAFFVVVCLFACFVLWFLLLLLLFFFFFFYMFCL